MSIGDFFDKLFNGEEPDEDDIDEIISIAFGRDDGLEPDKDGFKCDDGDDCVVNPPVEVALAIVTGRTLGVDEEDIRVLVMYTLRDAKIPMLSATAAIIATATELKKQHEWLAHVELPQEFIDSRDSRQRAILYRWLADIYELHGTTIPVKHATDPEWARGGNPDDVEQFLNRDGYTQLGEDSV